MAAKDSASTSIVINIRERILDGLRQDITKLIENYIAKEDHTFPNFASTWREMKFYFIFTSKVNQSELREFTEEAFLITLKFLDTTENSMQHSIAILFLMYCMFISQPLNPKIPFKLTIENYNRCRLIYKHCEEHQIKDACYVWLKLNSLGAFHFTHRERPMGPSYMKKHINTSLVPRSEIDFSSEYKDSINELTRIHQEYSNLKRSLPPENGAVKHLDLVSDSLFQEYTSIMKGKK
ncbi:snRNA-activating protein complex subunit 1-like [Brevipalpus obovatus]|uniref:snRNA-activating protein complex subunit 1-like n=1 Tax=Brevipalpus obovatus TaxID=246614 RepID=UPI003D9DC542